MIQATECAYPASTEADGCLLLRSASNQFVMCERSSSTVFAGPFPPSPGSDSQVSLRTTVGSYSKLPFSSTSSHRGVASVPKFMSVAFLPLKRLKLCASFPKLEEVLTRNPEG